MALLYFFRFSFLLNTLRESGMIAYEFYLRDPVKGGELIGILPERRKDPARITQWSVLHWAETVFGNGFINKDVYFIEATIKEDEGNIFPHYFVLRNSKEI